MLIFFLGISSFSFSQHDSTNVIIELMVESTSIGMDELDESDELGEENEEVTFLYVINLTVEDIDSISSIEVNLYNIATDSLFSSYSFAFDSEPANPIYTFHRFSNFITLGMGEYQKYSMLKCAIRIENLDGTFSPIIFHEHEIFED